jgi:hypothetical protein
MLRDKMYWHDNALFLGRRKTGFSIEADQSYANMYRVRKPDGTLSDMVNLTRAKDAAAVLAERHLDGTAVRPR